jgi:REP element-mobilizing transposase RayT
MSRNYKFHNKEGLYFVSFATVYWIDIFTRSEYSDIVVEALDFRRRQRGMEIYAWCIMPSHIHLVFADKDKNPSFLIGKIKEYTSKKIQQAISDNYQESRREWLLWMMKRAASKNSNVINGQLWQHGNMPIELWSGEVIEQKINYIHMNPVEAGYVTEPWHWKYSSANDYCGGKGILEIDYVQ